MSEYIIASIASGILFGILDALINANPIARKLYEVYKPIARETLNPLVGMLIDLVFGFVMAGMYLVLYDSLPGETGLVKGISFAILAWIFRVAMHAASQWMMFKVPVKTLLYSLATGLGEMLLIGLLYGLVLKPA